MPRVGRTYLVGYVPLSIAHVYFVLQSRAIMAILYVVRLPSNPSFQSDHGLGTWSLLPGRGRQTHTAFPVRL